MTRLLVLLTLVIGLAAMGMAEPAVAAMWGNIEPGVTTLEQVRDLYGRPTRETTAKVEGYDTSQWVYERSQAPEGLIRLTVDFGLLTPSGYQPLVVRLVTLDPKPLIFGRKTVIDGWGLPDREGSMEGLPTFIYRDGLFVLFEKKPPPKKDEEEEDNSISAVRLIFSIPQPAPGEKPAPKQ
ncbi:MAG TPA: hypothetical protein VMS64_20410 [Candidatus Methylomirabilis sp.]|nr:hypothetical protein [Candidatus Methylomirabilis sp.]